MRAEQIAKAATEFELSLDSAIKMRIRYLLGQIDLAVKYISEATAELPATDITTAFSEIIRLKEYQRRIKSGSLMKGITDEMVEVARKYPVDNLIEFIRGKALCFLHDDKTPSMTYSSRTGQARCWVCNKNINALDVLILRDGYEFIAAVKYLNS